MTRLTYTVEEAAELLGISRGSAYAAAKRGDFPTIRLNRRVLVPRAAFEKFLGAAPPGESAGDDAQLPSPSPSRFSLVPELERSS